MSDVSGVSSSSNMLRLTGLATGLDTEGMIQKLMNAENIKVDKMKQDRQYVQWKQDALRGVIKDFRELRSNYLLFDSPASTNLIKSQSYAGSTITSSNPNLLTATALPGAANGVSNVKVDQIAKAATLSGSNLNKNSASILNGTGSFDAADWNGKTITFNINGTDYTTAAINGVTDENNLQTQISAAINSVTELQGKINVSVDTAGDKITFTSLTDSNIKVTSGVTELSTVKVINPTLATTLGDLGLNADTTFAITQGTTVSSDITLKSTDTLQDAISKIYNTKADKNDNSTSPKTLYSDLKISYSELTGSLTMETRDTGSNESLQISGGLNILGFSGDNKQGQDAIVEITPAGSTTATTVTKQSNAFTIDNVTYNLIKDPNGVPYDVDLTTKADSQSSFDKIKGFIDKYNSLIEKVTNEVKEKKEYNYKPLTDTQKKSMKDDEIKSWEDKAKQGILRNDNDLNNVLTTLRSAFMDSVQSAGVSLKEIGIDTYSGTEAITKSGQLKIDEAKLKNALETKGDQVIKVFTAVPDASIVDATEKYNNTGILKRVEDILNKTVVKSDATLLQKAGYQGTRSEYSNMISDQLRSKDAAITEMNKKLSKKQEKYYQMFAKLEESMNKMNSQSSWLAQQFGGGN